MKDGKDDEEVVDGNLTPNVLWTEEVWIGGCGISIQEVKIYSFVSVSEKADSVHVFVLGVDRLLNSFVLNLNRKR